MAVQCSGGTGCQFAELFCPIHGLCDIDCPSNSIDGCSSVIVDARTMISGQLSFDSIYYSKGGNIHCPGNNNKCIIHCDESGCRSFTFYTQPDTAMLYIGASGTASLKSANIYCPFPNGN
eukprot:211214_1